MVRSAGEREGRGEIKACLLVALLKGEEFANYSPGGRVLRLQLNFAHGAIYKCHVMSSDHPRRPALSETQNSSFYLRLPNSLLSAVIHANLSCKNLSEYMFLILKPKP